MKNSLIKTNPQSMLKGFSKQETKDKTYKSPIYLEHQLFGNEDTHNYQMKTDLTPLVKYGLDLSFNQRKALAAIQILFAQTNYKGNSIIEEIHSQKLKGFYQCPYIDVSFYAYYQAYGLSEAQIKRRGKAVTEALHALGSLAEPFRIAYTKKVKDKSTKKVETVSICCNLRLIDLEEMYFLERMAKAKTEEEKDKRASFLRILIAPLLIEQIKSFYTLKPYFLHEKIDSVKKGASRRRSNLLLIDWLLTLNIPTVRISRIKLAYKLRLEKDIKARRQSRINNLLSEAIAIAKELNFISFWKKDDNDVYEFTLNPDQCSRIKKATPPEPEEIDAKELESLSLPEERF
ncbi:MAG: hypothetical protein AB4063_15420 [Crocosphaera sp.]